MIQSLKPDSLVTWCWCLGKSGLSWLMLSRSSCHCFFLSSLFNGGDDAVPWWCHADIECGYLRLLRIFAQVFLLLCVIGSDTSAFAFLFKSW